MFHHRRLDAEVSVGIQLSSVKLEIKAISSEYEHVRFLEQCYFSQ